MVNANYPLPKGATAIEYALVASLISIAALAAFQRLGDKIDLMYGNVSNKMYRRTRRGQLIVQR